MIKSIIKRIIIGVGVALALMFIKGNLLMSVNAKSILTHKAPFESYTYNNTVATFTTTIDSPFFANANVGNLYFTFAVNKSSGNSTFPISIIRTVVVYSGNTGYVCNIGSSSLSNSTYGGVTYSAQCPMNIGSSGVTRIVYYPSDLQSNDLSIYRFTNEGYFSFETDSNVNVTVDTSSTTNAINNQTTTITNNQDLNTQEIIQSQQDLLGTRCSNLFSMDNFMNNGTGRTSYTVSDNSLVINALSTGTYRYVYKLITGLSVGTTYTINVGSYTDTNSSHLAQWGVAKSNGDYYQGGPKSLAITQQLTFIAEENTIYVRFGYLSNSATSGDTLTLNNIQLVVGSSSSTFCPYGSSTGSKLDTTNDNLNNINNTLNNNDTDQVQQDSDSAFLNFNLETHGLTRAITAPIRLFQALLGTSCTPLSIPLPFVNQQVVLPCMTSIYEQYFGGFFTLYRLITTGIIGYWVAINTFRKSKDFLDPNNDKIEVFNL